MKRKTLLWLSEHQLAAWQWRPEGCAGPQIFVQTDEGMETFRRYLRQHRHPLWMLVDLTEEEFVYEGLPHINDLDHHAAALQRLAGHFPDTPLRMVIKQLRQNQTGQNDEMLYSALTRPARLQPWLDIIAALSVPLAGIYSVAHLCRELLPGAELERQMLVTLDEARLRTSYFYHDRLRFSRLTASDRLAERVWAEAYQTRPYLYNRRLLPREQPLPVHVLCHRSDWDEIQRSMPQDQELPLQWLDIEAAAHRIGVAEVPGNSDATPLFLHLLATRPPVRDYASDAMTRVFRQRNTRRALYALAVLLATSGLAWGATNLWQARQLRAEALSLHQQTRMLEQQADTLGRSLPSLPAPATVIRTVIERLQGLDQPPPQMLLDGVSRALDACPEAELLKLDWQQESPVQASLLLHLAPGADSLAELRQALRASGYRVTELQSGAAEVPAVLQLSWQREE
jgi:hypothetical protein